MPGWDDPRYVEQQFKALQKKVDELERKALPFALQQKGALPGSMRAVSVNDQGAKASMWMNFSNIGPGSGPYSAVTDTNGNILAEWGFLAALGLSPQQYGFRTRDTNGNPTFDTALGLIKGPVPVASNFVSASFTTSSTTPVLITSSGVTITPTNQVRVLVLYGGSVSYSGQTAFIDLFLDGSSKSAGGNGPALQLQYPTVTSGSVTSMGFLTTTLSATSHTIDLRASQNGVNSLTVLQCAIVVLQVGVV